jgi:hypothetical protein
MTFRSVVARSVFVVASLLVAASARGECIFAGRWWIESKSVELVFSGTVVEITRTAELGYRATFDVDRLWKGTVPRRFDLYIWEIAPEMDRVEVGRRYLVGAKRLVGPRERQGVGLAGTDMVAFSQVMCGAPAYEEAERRGTIRDLGVSEPPK